MAETLEINIDSALKQALIEKSLTIKEDVSDIVCQLIKNYVGMSEDSQDGDFFIKPTLPPEEAREVYSNRRSSFEDTFRKLLLDVSAFERKYKMSSEAFFEKFPRHELASDESDWFLWEMSYSALKRAFKENKITRDKFYDLLAT